MSIQVDVLSNHRISGFTSPGQVDLYHLVDGSASDFRVITRYVFIQFGQDFQVKIQKRPVVGCKQVIEDSVDLLVDEGVRVGQQKKNAKGTFNGKRYYGVKTSFQEALEKAGIKNFRFHDLRHCFASSLVQRGVDLYQVQRLLGHKSNAMTERYAHLAPENLRNAVMKLDEKLMTIL